MMAFRGEGALREKTIDVRICEGIQVPRTYRTRYMEGLHPVKRLAWKPDCEERAIHPDSLRDSVLFALGRCSRVRCKTRHRPSGSGTRSRLCAWPRTGRTSGGFKRLEPRPVISLRGAGDAWEPFKTIRSPYKTQHTAARRSAPDPKTSDLSKSDAKTYPSEIPFGSCVIRRIGAPIVHQLYVFSIWQRLFVRRRVQRR